MQNCPVSVPPLPLDGPNTKGWSELRYWLLTRTWKYGFSQVFPQASVKKVSKTKMEFILPYGKFHTQVAVGGCFMKSHICVKDDLVHVLGFTAGPIDPLGNQIIFLACSLFPTTWVLPE